MQRTLLLGFGCFGGLSRLAFLVARVPCPPAAAAAQVPFFWLSTYEGKGDPKDWTQQQQADFRESGARFVRVGDMAHGLGWLTRKFVEQPEDPDPHFCMPGTHTNALE